MAQAKVATPVTETQMVSFRLDLKGLHPNFDTYEQSLELSMPTLQYHEPLIAPEASEALHKAGFSDREIDQMVDGLWGDIEVQLLAKLLKARRR